MSRACGAAAWQGLATLAGRASEAERLELEGHLATCARCADDQAMLGLLRRLREADGQGLGAAAHERIRRAMRGHEPRYAMPPRTVRWPWAVGAALALTAAIVFVGQRGRLAGGGRPSVTASVRVISGDVVVSERSEGAEGVPAGVTTLRSETGGRAQLGDAMAELAPRTELHWNREGRELALRRGTVTIDRAPDAQGHVRIITADFHIEVAGARFTADGTSVRAERGSVRVVGQDGAGVDLGAGQSWSLPHREPPATAPPPVPTTAPARSATTMVSRAESGLARARQALGRGDAAGARAALEPLFRLERGVAAEARVLHAESFLIEGRYADAIEGYRVVARDFRGTGQAESALYAVAQLESEHGRPGDARVALRRYLDTYPSGRFVREATERMARLAP